MYGEQHLLTYKSEEEGTIVKVPIIDAPLSFRKLLWWLGGGFVSFMLASHVPPIPFVGYWGYVPHFLPFLVCALLSVTKHPATDLPLGWYMFSVIQFRRRKRVFF
ncbi:hypothetical protein QO009_003081 [Brevibacillus aydinogluensis]|uniref:hypothetical protein n=1 Tax=Brevibacillus aydinogluensis TaxID=927786 RepID=UPI002893253C|nr:hypothetical protein [Brevibacillus aydinogluensis]MDT3417186.1 hypothetical protein [Brevibacillus aydinogluensis]